MREDDIKNPRTKNYSSIKYFLLILERGLRKYYYLILSFLNIRLSKKKKSIFIGKYKDTRFLEFIFFSLSNDYDFVYEFSSGLSNFIKKIGVINFFKKCRRGKASECSIIFYIDNEKNKLESNSINFNTDYFFLTDNNLENKNVLPYYMYPKIYKNLYKQLNNLKSLKKNINIIFSGSTNQTVYNRFKWKNQKGIDLLNRCEIIEIIEKNFKDKVSIVKNYSEINNEISSSKKILLFKNDSMVKKEKALLSTYEHLKKIAMSEFFITAPGTEMPLCHHFIEAIKFGTIPITNYGNLILPKIDTKYFLQYSSKNELIECIKRALNMSSEEKTEIKNNLIKIYQEKFSPGSFLKKIKKINLPAQIYANNDHDSVRLREKRIGI